MVDDSEGLRLSLRGVQGVAAGVPHRLLLITQEDDVETGFRLAGTIATDRLNTKKKKISNFTGI